MPRSQRRLLTVLGLRRTCSRAQIAGLLWADVPDARAFSCLRTALWRFDPRDLVVVDSEKIDLSADVGVDVDELAVMAHALEHSGCPQDVERLRT